METEMEMPTPCIHCHEIFDLLDGYGSEKWYRNTTICAKCFDLEEKEIEEDEEIREQKERLENAIYDINDSVKYLESTSRVDVENPLLPQYRKLADTPHPPVEEKSRDIQVVSLEQQLKNNIHYYLSVEDGKIIGVDLLVDYLLNKINHTNVFNY